MGYQDMMPTEWYPMRKHYKPVTSLLCENMLPILIGRKTNAELRATPHQNVIIHFVVYLKSACGNGLSASWGIAQQGAEVGMAMQVGAW